MDLVNSMEKSGKASQRRCILKKNESREGIPGRENN